MLGPIMFPIEDANVIIKTKSHVFVQMVLTEKPKMDKFFVVINCRPHPVDIAFGSSAYDKTTKKIWYGWGFNKVFDSWDGDLRIQIGAQEFIKKDIDFLFKVEGLTDNSCAMVKRVGGVLNA